MRCSTALGAFACFVGASITQGPGRPVLAIDTAGPVAGRTAAKSAQCRSRPAGNPGVESPGKGGKVSGKTNQPWPVRRNKAAR